MCQVCFHLHPELTLLVLWDGNLCRARKVAHGVLHRFRQAALIWSNTSYDHWTAGSAAGFVGLGILVLIPGAYASTIAAGAWLKAPGFKFEMMPRMARSP